MDFIFTTFKLEQANVTFVNFIVAELHLSKRGTFELFKLFFVYVKTKEMCMFV